MSPHVDLSRLRPTRPLVAEFAVVTAVLLAVTLWRHVVTGVVTALAGSVSDGVVVYTLATNGPFVAGVVAFAGAYAAARGVDGGVSFPPDAKPVALAVAIPLALVALTKLAGTFGGVPYNSFTKTAYAVDAPVGPVAVLAGLGLLVSVPVVVSVCQVLVQGSLRRAVGGDAAVVLTTLVAGFVMVDTTGRLTAVPDAGKLVGVVAFVLLLSLGLYGHGRIATERFRPLAYLPVALFVCLVGLAGVTQVDSVAAGLFAVTQVVVFGVAAYAYEQTGSLLPSALAYACLLAANTAVVYGFEAGLQHW